MTRISAAHRDILGAIMPRKTWKQINETETWEVTDRHEAECARVEAEFNGTATCPHCEEYERAIDELGCAFDNFDWDRMESLSFPQKSRLHRLNGVYLKTLEARGWSRFADEVSRELDAEAAAERNAHDDQIAPQFHPAMLAGEFSNEAQRLFEVMADRIRALEAKLDEHGIL